MAILNLKNVSYTYPQAERATLREVSFSVERGEYIALLGKNGSGKSTLARLLAGFFSADSGTIEREQELLQGIVFQEPKDQIIAGIVERDTAFGPKNLSLSPAEIEMRTIECLSVVSLTHKAEARTFELSLGQTQRLAFSGILALYPDLFILDEVTAMLDPKARGDLIEFVGQWNKKGHTIIHVTHDEEEALRAKRILVLDEGKIIFDGNPEEFLADKNLFVSIFGIKSELYKMPLSKTDLDSKETALSVEHLSFYYDKNENHADKIESIFSDLNFSLKKGTLTALTGPSGCGKSTLFECLAGLKTPNSGKICANSRPVLALQESEAALFERYAADDVAFGPQNRGVNGKELLKTVQNAMALSGLSYNDFANKNTFALSGGEKRKLSLAGIIALDADILIFDEPTSALDPQSRKIVIQTLQKLAAQGKTVLFSTHRMEEADCADVQLSWEEILKAGQKTKAHNLPPQEPLKNAQMLVSLQKMGAALTAPSKIPESPISHLNAGAKSALFLILFALSVVSPNIPLCALSFALSVLYAILAHYPLKKPFVAFTKFLPWIIFFATLQFAFYSSLGDTEILFKWNWFVITKSKIQVLIKMFLRAPAIITTLGTFIFSTDERQILDGLTTLTKPLAKLGIPVRYAVLTVGITFRFIPILLDEAAGIIKTQIVRGAFANARGLAKLKILLPLFVPLLMQSLRKARHISDALTARYFS